MPDLTGIPALDLAIGLAFIYLLLSLFCSAVQESIAGVLNLRAKTLEKGLRNMLEEEHDLPPWMKAPPAGLGPARKLADDLYAHPLMRSLYRKRLIGSKLRPPSYISPRIFALALLDTLAPPAPPDKGTASGAHPDKGSKGALAEKADADVVRTLEDSIEKLSIPGNIKHTLLTLLNDARGDIDGFRTRLEAWFDDSMARVSGWYKRQAQLILTAIAIVVTVALNANSLVMGDRLYKDPAVRAAVVQRATSQNRQPPSSQELKNAADNVDSLAKLGVPLGWAQNSADDPRHFSFASASGAIHVLGGWLLTIVALSLGAAFWFDSLSRLARLRASGKPETPLPASGRGHPQERVVTHPAPVHVNVHTGAPPTA